MKRILRIVLSCICAAIAFLFGWLLKSPFGRKEASVSPGKKFEEVKHEIEKTSAVDLVAAAPNSEQLHANAAGIAEQYREQFRDRTRNAISGFTGSGTDADSGRRN